MARLSDKIMANTITDKLTYLSGTKEAIKQSIIAKGVEVTDTDTFRSYADKIESIQSGGTVSLVTGTKLSYSTFSTIPDEYISYLESQTDMSYMFSHCTKLTSVPQFSTSRVTSANSMFYNCELLTIIPQFNTSSLTSANAMFSHCTKLTSVPLLDFSSVTDVGGFYFYDSMFWGCSSLTTLGGFKGLKVNLDLHYSPLLTIESIVNVINAAADMSSEPQTLTLHKDVFNILTEEQIATASAKGWNIASK